MPFGKASGYTIADMSSIPILVKLNNNKINM
jgi:hypothetical protein